jgi:hypothetical protein
MVFQIVHFDFRLVALLLIIGAIAMGLDILGTMDYGDVIASIVMVILAIYILISTKDIVFTYKKHNGEQ